MSRFVAGVCGVASLAIGLLGYSPTSEACSLAGDPEHELDPLSTDTNPPSLTIGGLDVKRGSGNCGQPTDSCADLGTLALEVSTTDNETATPEMGYELEVYSGTAPIGLSLSEKTVRYPDGVIRLHWIDGADDEQEPIDFILKITLVDLAGNNSEPLQVIIDQPGIEDTCDQENTPDDPGNDSGGCTATGSGSGAPTGVLVLLALGLFARRRRSRQRV